AQEREFLLKPLFCSRSYEPVANLQLPDIGRRARWFRRTREAARLSREFQVFRVELAFLEQRSQTPAKAWVQAAKDHLANVERCLKSKRFRSNDIEEAWCSLHAAQRQAIFGLEDAELTDRAMVLMKEADKISSWRESAIKKLLSPDNGRPTHSRVSDAMALRDEYSANQYHKISLLGDQLRVVLGICSLASFMLLPIIIY